MVWIWLGPLIGILSVMVIVGGMATLHELNPDPDWRKREAEIRRLEQEKRLRELRRDA
jgi:hypothetical protein